MRPSIHQQLELPLKITPTHLVRQELARKGCLSGAVRPCDDDDLLLPLPGILRFSTVGQSSTAAVMASGGSAGFNRSNAARNRDTSTTSPFVSRSNVPVAPKVSSNAKTVVQPSSANNPMAGCPTSWFSV